MLSISLSVIGLAFLPVLLINAFSSEHHAWIASSIIAVIWLIAVAIRIRIRTKPVHGLHGYIMAGHRVIAGLGTLSIGGFLTNATGLVRAYYYELYLGSLLVGLAMAGLLFGRVIASLLERRPND
jgi:hypothetical protein